ncbi:DUF4123 domain-containing protein [Pseudomonas gessardii]|uniref:DUF4123 domain-containing protein n=1 Tax=Pseudomonas gessardii TaxID=78544 RepID=UPI00147617BF|nr:DUF4123 domain-containing protein [Pseudomonas gessardii]NNA70341.1 DUF4123 domain-containing protein [Pseudomonas gessardii]
MARMPGQWMTQQQQAGRRLCLILEGNNDALQRLMASGNRAQYCNLYGTSAVAELAAAGPVILSVEHLGEPALVGLLEHPEANWGWLGSLPDVDLGSVIEHWQARMLVGPPGNQALYRFHDNRTLARALGYLPVAQWPAYLGPLISVCYWHEAQWCSASNPAPGKYPVPDPVPWLNLPNPQAKAILQANILRYLLAEHSENLVALVEFQDPKIWLAHVLDQARTWQWREPEQLEFLVVRRLEEATRASVLRWPPLVAETPGDHFGRVVEQWRTLGHQHE